MCIGCLGVSMVAVLDCIVCLELVSFGSTIKDSMIWVYRVRIVRVYRLVRVYWVSRVRVY